MGIISAYNYLFHELGDQRFKDNLLTDTPWLMLAILLLYYLFVRIWGPRFMKNREPCSVQWIMTIYNILQIAWNVYMTKFNSAIYPVLAWNIRPWHCFPLNMTLTPAGYYMRYGGILYFSNKVFDLLDTVFMVLRKKNRQISSLHLSHHMIMVAGFWVGLKYSPGGNGCVIVIFNSLIHTIMYSYYQLSLMGYEWVVAWKPHLTMLQMAQFGLVFMAVVPVFFDADYCGNNLFTSVLCLLFAFYFVFTFSHFYVKTYLKPQHKRWELYIAAHEERLKKRKSSI